MKVVSNKLTGERVEVHMPVESAKAFLLKHPIDQFDTDLGEVIWFHLTLLQQMVALVGFTESICEAEWEGPGWYQTRLVKEYNHNWLRLEKGSPDEDMHKARTLAADGLRRLRHLRK